jgi:type I restriction enzyme M protein
MSGITGLKNWLKRRYLELLNNFKDNGFTFEEVVEFLNKRFNDTREQVKVILSEFNKAGVLEIAENPEDRREKIYKLKPLFEKVNHVNTKDTLINLLKQAADLIRTRVDYTFILLLLFYKAYSDKWQKEFEEQKKKLLELGWQEAEAVKEATLEHYHTFNFPQEYLWENIRKEPQRISEKFSIALKN